MCAPIFWKRLPRIFINNHILRFERFFAHSRQWIIIPSFHPHIRPLAAAVGFGLYCQLLQRTIAALKGEKLKEIVDVKLNLDFIDWSPASEDDDTSAALPYSYVEEDAMRISLIKRFAEAMDERVVKALAREMQDRFGPLPKAAQRMVRLALLRVKAAQAGIGIIDVKDKRAILYRNGTRDIANVLDLRGKTADRKIQELTASL